MKRLVSDRYFLGRKCIYCDSNKLYRLKTRGKIKCKHCKKYYSLRKLKQDLEVLYYFYLEVSARKTAKELGLNYKTVQSKFMNFRKDIAIHCNAEADKLNGELELDERYFGEKRKEQEEEERKTRQLCSVSSREKEKFTQLSCQMFPKKH